MRKTGKPSNHLRTRVNERVNAKIGQVMVDADDATRKEAGMGRRKRVDDWAWCIWPEDLNSLQAIMMGVMVGPFPSEEAAREAAKETWWEKRPA